MKSPNAQNKDISSETFAGGGRNWIMSARAEGVTDCHVAEPMNYYSSRLVRTHQSLLSDRKWQ